MDNRGARRTTCRRGLLAWTDEQSEHADQLANAVAFPNSDHGWYEGVRFDWHEVVAAAEDLTNAGLIRSSVIRGSGGASRVDVAITEDGRTCLDGFGGDLAAYVAAKNPTAPTINVSGTGNALSIALGYQSAGSLAGVPPRELAGFEQNLRPSSFAAGAMS